MLVSLVAYALSLVVATLAAGDTPDGRVDDDEARARGRAIAKAALEKQGGAKAFASIRGFVMTASGTTMGGRITVERRVLCKPVLCIDEDVRRRTANGVEPLRVVVRGDRGRRLERGRWVTLSRHELRRQQGRYYRTPFGIYASFADERVTIRHERTVGDGASRREVVAIERRGHAPVSVTIDPADGRLLEASWTAGTRSRSGAPPPRRVLRFERHAAFGPLRAVPMRIVATVAGKPASDRTTETVRINPPLEPADFPAGDAPDQPADGPPADRTQSR